MCVFFSELKNDDFAEIMSIYYINFVSSKNKNVEKYRILSVFWTRKLYFSKKRHILAYISTKLKIIDTIVVW